MVEPPVKCTNLGCNQSYLASENNDTACHYHLGPVIFHDIKKGYSCCNRVVYDWDEFQQIRGCQVGAHSDQKKDTNFYKSNTVSNAERAIQREETNKVRSIEDFEKEMEEKRRKEAENKKTQEKMPVMKDGLYVCANFGCNKNFSLEENIEGSCHYHSSGPGFHDVKKFWTCCNAEAWDWDDFMKLPTCSIGVHKVKYK
ncbi:unnamed protein product [Blepharisma stoltei]|uniref:CHORD domain-containing protein n=1 Tax=Blepharisma stoltei TaxID=1481888 RepID=A0AAU9JT91_9CILI|nr:unnamed protein product [Blepharisma stoltei]